MTDQQILEHIGLTPSELEDFLAKFNRFLDDLNPAQREMLLHNLKTPKEAAAELGGDVTVDQLEDLFRRYAPPRGIIFAACRKVSWPPGRHK